MGYKHNAPTVLKGETTRILLLRSLTADQPADDKQVPSQSEAARALAAS